MSGLIGRELTPSNIALIIENIAITKTLLPDGEPIVKSGFVMVPPTSCYRRTISMLRLQV